VCACVCVSQAGCVERIVCARCFADRTGHLSKLFGPDPEMLPAFGSVNPRLHKSVWKSSRGRRSYRSDSKVSQLCSDMSKSADQGIRAMTMMRTGIAIM